MMLRNVTKKIEKLIEDKIKEQLAKKVNIIENIKDVPKGELFSKNAVFRAVNLETFELYEFIGSIVKFYLVNKPNIKQALENGQIDAFESGKFYIKFYRYVEN